MCQHNQRTSLFFSFFPSNIPCVCAVFLAAGESPPFPKSRWMCQHNQRTSLFFSFFPSNIPCVCAVFLAAGGSPPFPKSRWKCQYYHRTSLFFFLFPTRVRYFSRGIITHTHGHVRCIYAFCIYIIQFRPAQERSNPWQLCVCVCMCVCVYV